MLSELFFLACGAYIGKYYPEYVPIPRIRREYVDAILAYIKSLQSPTALVPVPVPASATTPTNELKTE